MSVIHSSSFSSQAEPRPKRELVYYEKGSKAWHDMRDIVCILKETELAKMWRLMYDDDGKTMPISFGQCEEMMDEMSKYRVSPDNYVLTEAPGIFTLDKNGGMVEGIWRSPPEDELAAASDEEGVAARKLAAGEHVHLSHLEKVPTVCRLAIKYKLPKLTEWVRDNLPDKKDANGYDMCSEQWSHGLTLKLLDWWMRYSPRYTFDELERKRGSCTYAKIMKVASEISVIIGNEMARLVRAQVFAQSSEEGKEARKIWKHLYENRKQCIITDGKPAILRIKNPDGSIRMQLVLKRLCYDEQIAHNRGRAAYVHTHPRTIRGFTIAFFSSLFGEGNFTDTGNGSQVQACLDHLRSNANSGLFHGYAWELEVNGKVYFKS